MDVGERSSVGRSLMVKASMRHEQLVVRKLLGAYTLSTDGVCRSWKHQSTVMER